MRSGRFEGVDMLVSTPFPFEFSDVGGILKDVFSIEKDLASPNQKDL